MNPGELAAFLSEKGFSVKEVPLMNTIQKLGKDGVNTFDLTSTFTEKVKVNTFDLTSTFSEKIMGAKFWTCKYCAKMFDNQIALNNHIKVEHYNISTSGNDHCDIKNVRYIDNAIKYSHPNKEETSYIIIKTFPEDDLGLRKRGVRRVDSRPRKPYDKKVVGLNDPIEINGPFKCNACNEQFDDCCNYSLHVNCVHLKRRRLILRCQICEKRFGGKSFNEEPEPPYDQNPPSPRLTCDICGKSFSLESHLEFHHKKYHSKIKPYECSLCSKSFSQITGLSQHMKTHSGIRPFVCNVCSKAFRQKAGLDQHMRIHSKVKPFNCLLCSRAFTQSAHLSQHMRIHTKIEPFECGLCTRRFKQSSHLNFHLRSHETCDFNDKLYDPLDSGITITALPKSY